MKCENAGANSVAAFKYADLTTCACTTQHFRQAKTVLIETKLCDFLGQIEPFDANKQARDSWWPSQARL